MGKKRYRIAELEADKQDLIRSVLQQEKTIRGLDRQVKLARRQMEIWRTDFFALKQRVKVAIREERDE